MRYVGICDDEQGVSLLIEMVTRDYFETRKIDYEIIVTHDPYAFLEQCAIYDLVIMDVNLRNEIDGVQTISQMRKTNKNAQVIFLTAYDHRLDALEVHCYRYLFKPFDINTYTDLLDDVLECLPDDKSKIVLQTTEGTISIKMNGLYYCERCEPHTTIVTITRKYTSNLLLTEIEKKMEGYPMWRCHRTFLVNTEAIKVSDTNEIVMKNGDVIPISRRRSKENKK